MWQLLKDAHLYSDLKSILSCDHEYGDPSSTTTSKSLNFQFNFIKAQSFNEFKRKKERKKEGRKEKRLQTINITKRSKFE